MEDFYDCQQLLKIFRDGQMTPERSGEYWGDDEREKLVDLYHSGVGISQIAWELHRSEMAVVQQLITSKLLTSPGAQRSRRPTAPHCLCENCQLCRSCHRYKEGTNAGNL